MQEKVDNTSLVVRKSRRNWLVENVARNIRHLRKSHGKDVGCAKQIRQQQIGCAKKSSKRNRIGECKVKVASYCEKKIPKICRIGEKVDK